MYLIALLAVFSVILPALAYADLNEDFAACRRIVIRLGDDAKAPADQYCLGLSYGFALNHKRDWGQAAKWFRKAAEQNHAPAQAVLGYLYERGNGVKADPAEAAKWYRKSADQNNSDGLFNLGRAYEHGIGLSKDLTQARTYYSKAAAAGSQDARQALAGLGKGPVPVTPEEAKFEEGVTLYKAKDFAGAAKIFHKLADKGLAKAQLQIGYQYEVGEGVHQSFEDAVRWYRKAAEQGHAAAQSNVGMMYEEGRGVKENWSEALQWYRKSAQQGNPNGQFRLGRMYQFGMAVPQNRQEAIVWFDKAGDQGHDQANYFANHLKARNSYVGFRNDQERDAVVGLKLRMVTLNIEPVGRTFRNSAERIAYLKQAGQQADKDEAALRYEWKRQEYQACRDAGRSGCLDPGPP